MLLTAHRNSPFGNADWLAKGGNIGRVACELGNIFVSIMPNIFILCWILSRGIANARFSSDERVFWRMYDRSQLLLLDEAL